MRNLRVDAKHEFEQEKGAVIEELNRDEDEPWDIELKTILPLLFGKTAPYGHPVIGERKHVEDATAKIIKGHYDKWYHPNNASLVIVGGFDADKALTKIKQLFGPIPPGKLPERKPVPELKSERPAKLEIASKFDVPRAVVGFNTVSSDHADNHTLDVIQALLSGGKTSRLYRKLVEGDEIATAVSASNNAGRYPGWFSIQLELLKGKDRTAAESTLLKELSRLADEPVTDRELKRVKQILVAGAVFGRESVHDLADSIARGVTTNNLDYLKSYLPKIMAVTAADVQRVAKKYLDPSRRVVVWSVPGSGKAGGDKPNEPKKPGRSRQTPPSGGGTEPFSLKGAQRVELPNGLLLLLLEDHRLPIVVAQAMVRRVGLYEPVEKLGIAALTGSLLDEGTAKRTGQQIAEMIEDVGGNLSLSSSGGSVQVLSANRSLGLELLFECLIRPSFPADAFNRQKEQQLSRIDDAEQQPDTKAQMIYREMVYGKHPLGRPGLGKRATVAGLTAADCVSFHKQMFVPNNTVVAIVGDFDRKQLIEEITRLTADWKPGELPKPELPEVTRPKTFTQKINSMPTAAQLHFYMGHPGIRRTNPDYYKLLVMDY